jgi:hypothetical protein
VGFLETSALQSVNIEKAFKIMIDEIYGKFNKQLDESEGDTEINRNNFVNLNNLNTNEKKEKPNKCC